jgi:ketosteroid isomerase-like protein
VSQEHQTERIVRAMYARFNPEGPDAVAEEFFDPQIEYRDDPLWPGGGAHNGREAVVLRFKEVIEVLGIDEVKVERVVDTGNEVAWVIQAVGRSPGADVPNAHRWGYVGRIADGKFVYFRAYHDAAEAITPAGVEP